MSQERKNSFSRRTLLELGLLLAALAMALIISVALVALAGGFQKPGATASRRPDHVTSHNSRAAAPAWLEHRVAVVLRQAVERQTPPLSTPALEQAITTIRTRLLAVPPASLGSSGATTIIVVDSPQANAVTLPGGLIVVYGGLLHHLHGAEELAAVIAHEMGHVAAHDPVKRASRALVLTAVLSVFSARTPVLLQRAARRLLDARFTRSQEEAADAFALRLLAAAHMDPLSLASALEELRDGARLPNFLQPLNDHPRIESRIAIIEAQAHLMKVKVEPLGVEWRRVLESIPAERHDSGG